MGTHRLRRLRRRLILLLAAVVALTLYLGHTLTVSREPTAFVPAVAPEGAKANGGTLLAAPDAGQPASNTGDSKDSKDSKDDIKSDNVDNGDNGDDSDNSTDDPAASLNPWLFPMVSMTYDTSARPPIKGFSTVVAELPIVMDSGSIAATKSIATHSPLHCRRLVFVGDVHGQRDSLDALLAQVGFNAARDHLVLAGDLVNKGPDSAGVLQLAMDLGASAVRGNHDDRILLVYEAAHQESQSIIEAEGRRERALARLWREEEERRRQEEEAKADGGGGGGGWLATLLGLDDTGMSKSEEEMLDLDRVNADLEAHPSPVDSIAHIDEHERAVAASLSPEQYRWLADLPTILHIGAVATESHSAPPDLADVVVVHAGLVPGKSLAAQDPQAVTTMRSFMHPADEARRARARAILEYEARALTRGQLRGAQPRVAESRVEALYQKLRRSVYGSDFQHPRLSPPVHGAVVDALSPARSPLWTASDTDLILLPVEGHVSKGRDNNRLAWSAVWNQIQHAKPASETRTTVIYGHDAITGLAVPPRMPRSRDKAMSTSPTATSASTGWLAWLTGGLVRPAASAADHDTGYTFGLDSGCVYGHQLTALVVEAAADGSVRHYIEQVDCPFNATGPA